MKGLKNSEFGVQSIVRGLLDNDLLRCRSISIAYFIVVRILDSRASDKSGSYVAIQMHDCICSRTV